MPLTLVQQTTKVVMGVLSEQTSEFLERCRRSRKLVLIIVAIALLLDNMLLTTVGEYNTH